MAVSATSTSLTAEELAYMRDMAAAMPTLLSGVLDDRISALKAIQEDLNARQDAIVTVAQAAQVKADADTYAASIKGDADLIQATAKAALDSANAQAQTVATQSADLQVRSEQFNQLQIAASNALQAAQADIAQRETNLRIGNEALKSQQDQLAVAQTTLAAVQTKLNAKLAVLSS